MTTEPDQNAPLTEDDIHTLGRLARLELEPAAVGRLKTELGAVLGRAACLIDAALDGIEPMARPIEEANRLDDDEPGETLPVEAVGRLAPAFEGAHFVVPRVLGDEHGQGGGA